MRVTDSRGWRGAEGEPRDNLFSVKVFAVYYWRKGMRERDYFINDFESASSDFSTLLAQQQQYEKRWSSTRSMYLSV